MNTTRGSLRCTQPATESLNATSSIRVTYNASSATAKIFIDGDLSTSCSLSKSKTPAEIKAHYNTSIIVGSRFCGAIKELYLKYLSVYMTVYTLFICFLSKFESQKELQNE